MKIKNLQRGIVPVVGVSRPRKYAVGGVSFEEAIYGNVWFRLMHMPKGSRKRAHRHNFDHIHFVASGAVKLFEVNEKEGKAVKRLLGEYRAPAWIKVPKGVGHEVESLEDGTVAICVQAVRDKDGQILQTDYLTDSKDVEVTRL